MVHRAPQAAVRLQKSLSVRRSDEDPRQRWWSLPLSLPEFGRCFATDLRHADALVRPHTAVDSVDAVILAVETDEVAVSAEDEAPAGGTTGVQLAPERLHRRLVPEGALCFRDVSALLDLADRGRVAPCRISIHPDGATEALFHVDIPAPHSARPQFCFERPGDAVRALECLALGRRFGGDAVAVEQAMLQHEVFSHCEELSLQLVLEQGNARLESVSRDGCRRTCHLHSVEGLSGKVDVRSRWMVWHESLADWRRHFPVNVILFAGLPLFIGFFRMGAALWRRLRP